MQHYVETSQYFTDKNQLLSFEVQEIAQLLKSNRDTSFEISFCPR